MRLDAWSANSETTTATPHCWSFALVSLPESRSLEGSPLKSVQTGVLRTALGARQAHTRPLSVLLFEFDEQTH